MSAPQWLRNYKVIIAYGTNPDGTQNALDVSDLRCVFEIVKAYKIQCYSDITIYNPSQEIEQLVIQAGMRVIVQASYGSDPLQTIFDGDVIQPLWDRENVTDFKVTLHCVDGDNLLNNNFIDVTFGPNQDYKTLISQMAAQCRYPIPIGYMSPDLQAKALPRGKVCFGDPKKYLRQFAQDNQADFSIIDGIGNFTKITDQSDVSSAFVLSPSTGLIGTPIQTQDGVALRCLLNPAIKIKPGPYQLIKLENSLIRQQKIYLNQTPSRLDADGLYKVAQVTYLGDTRGDQWYCDIIGINSDAQGLTPQMMAQMGMTGQ